MEWSQLYFDCYHAACRADAAWSAALQRMYGRHAGDARYDKRGTATPELLKLADAKRNKDQAMTFALYLMREAPALRLTY